MDYANMIITEADLDNYLNKKKRSKVNRILDGILYQLPPDLRDEAISKGFKLVEKDRALDLINFKIEVPNASPKLQSMLDEFYPFIICDINH